MLVSIFVDIVGHSASGTCVVQTIVNEQLEDSESKRHLVRLFSSYLL
jgi:hypothetical protein